MNDAKTEIARRELFRLYREVTDPFSDGFTQWGNKQALIDIKYLLDDIMKNCQSFGKFEEDYIKQKELNQVMNILKK